MVSYLAMTNSKIMIFIKIKNTFNLMIFNQTIKNDSETIKNLLFFLTISFRTIKLKTNGYYY